MNVRRLNSTGNHNFPSHDDRMWKTVSGLWSKQSIARFVPRYSTQYVWSFTRRQTDHNNHCVLRYICYS